MNDRIRVLVLLSGGLDSAATLGYFVAKQADVVALFIDYGQPALREERRAAEYVAQHFGVKIISVSIRGLTKRSGPIAGRNAAFALIALWELGPRRSLIAMGIRDTETFSDCGPRFIEQLNTIADLYTGGLVRFSAPLMQFTKQEVINFAAQLGITRSDVHSCDRAGPSQCGECTSCREYANAADA